MDRRAWELCRIINQSQNPKVRDGVIPAVVAELCSDVLKLLSVRTGAKDWEQLQLRRMAGDARNSMLLRGLGLPDADAQRSRILVMIEEVGRRQRASLEQAKDLFHLTDREQAVVEQLVKGWTNKQIAIELGIVEQTVKEHIKHIMQKTKASTRTGILVQILAQDTEQETGDRLPGAIPQPVSVISMSKMSRRRRRSAASRMKRTPNGSVSEFRPLR